jgi:2-methylaconitate cis-trans-isomerase PrpF
MELLGKVDKLKRVKLKLNCSGEMVQKVQVEKIILKQIIQKVASVAAVSTFNIKEGFHTTKINFLWIFVFSIHKLIETLFAFLCVTICNSRSSLSFFFLSLFFLNWDQLSLL